MLTPADISSKEFGTTRLKEGYNQDEVDDFLDAVQEQLQVVMTRLAAAEERVKVLERVGNAPTTQMPVVPPAPVDAPGILRLAQDTADKHVAEAKTQGAGIVAEAEALAESIKGAAVAERERLKNEGHVEAARLKTEGMAERQRVVDELEARHSQVAAAVERLLAEGTKIRAALNQAVAHYESQVPPT